MGLLEKTRQELFRSHIGDIMIKILHQTPEKEVSDKDRREFDDEDTVICFLSSKIREVCIEARRNRMIWVFDAKEINELHNNLLSGKPIIIDYNDVIVAKRKWLNSLFMLRSYLKSNA